MPAGPLRDPSRVDVLQKSLHLAVLKRPDVRHTGYAGLTRLLVLPRVLAVGHDRVAIGNVTIDADRPAVAEITQAHEDILDDGLRTDVGPGQRRTVCLGPRNVIGECGHDGCDVAGGESLVHTLNNVFIGHHRSFVVVIVYRGKSWRRNEKARHAAGKKR
jgi:hypothetical protein